MLNTTTQFIVDLFLLVAASVAAGEICIRLGQAALVGQILVGVILGPTLLEPVLGLGNISSNFADLQILATFFILMMAGLSVTPEQIRATGLSAGLLGIAIFLIPFLLGAGVVHVLYPQWGWLTTLFISLTISITALPVLGIMLREMGLLETKFGSFLMNTAIVNELAAVSTFAVLLEIQTGTHDILVDTAIAIVTVAVFLSTVLAVHYGLRSLRQMKVWGRMVSQFREGWRSREAWFALLMVAGLAAALYSQFLGLTFLVGAFYAGLLITPESAGPRQHRQIRQIFDTVTWGFFIPLFFALVGVSMDFRLIGASVVAISAFAALVLFAFFSKVFVGSSFARTLGWSPSESLGAGFLVASRGAVELAMAVILLQDQVFTPQQFTIVAGVGLLTTLLAPIGAGSFVRTLTAERASQEEEQRRASFLPLPPPRLVTGADDERAS